MDLEKDRTIGSYRRPNRMLQKTPKRISNLSNFDTLDVLRLMADVTFQVVLGTL
jgi:hypothetical protein